MELKTETKDIEGRKAAALKEKQTNQQNELDKALYHAQSQKQTQGQMIIGND